MPKSSKDPLREFFKQKLEALASDPAKGDTSREYVESVIGLAKIIELRDSLEAKPRNWWPAVGFVGILAVVSLLQSRRVSKTEIELDASVTELSFVSAKWQKLSGALNLSALGMDGLRDARLPQSEDPLGKRAAAVSKAPALSLLTFAEGGDRGSLTIDSLFLPANAEVTLACS